MKGVMLVNMGGPESPEELKVFLARMFKDPYILPYGKPVRNLLSFIISRARYRESWKKYDMIGGTPLVRSTRKTAASLQTLLGNTFTVKFAFSYSSPDIRTCLNAFKTDNIQDITVIPLYPQSSLTTTSSVVADIRKVTDKDPFFKVRVQDEFYNHPGYNAFWITNIQRHLYNKKIEDPTLVFSAHSIPEYNISNGDTYAASIVNSAASIATEMGLPYEAAFQSGMRRGKWIGPDIKEHLKTMREEGIDNLVLVPISFVHENLETLYDLDRDIIPYALETLGFKHVSRVNLPETDPILVSMLADLIVEN
jgi:protoporphyrin/coproporphyrin ferrochelatase